MKILNSLASPTEEIDRIIAHLKKIADKLAFYERNLSDDEIDIINNLNRFAKNNLNRSNYHEYEEYKLDLFCAGEPISEMEQILRGFIFEFEK